jgi:hypothetical protein
MAVELPKTTAETSNYLSTSRYADVMAFVGAIQRADPDVRVETFATTGEGRALPLVVAGPYTPRSARASGKPVVFIMANIHAGEVEGKEAAQMLLRDLVSTHRTLRDDLVILVAPIYNADGNERIAPEHRETQMGPLNGVGVRENAQGLDLNRDYMKLETAEGRGLIANVLDRWDPLLTVDLHTTNGSYHGYHLTYAPPLTPNADDDVVGFERGTLLPHIREAMRARHGKETYYYGNFVEQLQPEKGWYTFDNRPRFGNNYAGLRNRFAILSEAYSYIDFRARVEVTHEFLHEILAGAVKYGRKMQRIAARADERIARGRLRKLGLRFELAKWKDGVEILWEKSLPAPEGEGAPDPWTECGSIVRTGEIVAMKMPDYGVFKTTEREELPWAYLFDSEHAAEVLKTHGISVEKLDADATLDAERFAVKEETRAEQEFQQHYEVTVTGKWKSKEETFAAGTFLVRTSQPLARLIFYLLEPRSDDGLVNWNVLDAAKVWRIEKPVGVVTSESPCE